MFLCILIAEHLARSETLPLKACSCVSFVSFLAAVQGDPAGLNAGSLEPFSHVLAQESQTKSPHANFAEFFHQLLQSQQKGVADQESRSSNCCAIKMMLRSVSGLSRSPTFTKVLWIGLFAIGASGLRDYFSFFNNNNNNKKVGSIFPHLPLRFLID